MENRSKNSIRKIKSLVFLMLLTLILAITATYAWFSTQRDIEVSGMRLNVEVAESLQISLDGEIWTQSIQIANMRQFYGTYTGTGDGFAIYQAKKPDEGGNTNYVPTELLPVSSAGEVANGKLQFIQGTIESNADGTTKLTGITACSEADLTATETVANRQNGNAQHPYLVFDMYLRNISAKTTGLDELLLNAGSAVWVNSGTTDDGDQEGKGVAGTGLEYSARVGMVVYGNTISTTATDTADKTIGQQIRELGAKGDEVAAIWEPNNKEHTAYVVSNNGRGITSTSQEVDTYGVKVEVASAATKEIVNINSTTDTNLVAVNTFTPEYTTAAGGVDEKTIITNTSGSNLGIAPNQISKVRIYVWLEGQDPDCIDLASTGDKLNVTLKLTKDQTTSIDKNTYTGEANINASGPKFGVPYSNSTMGLDLVFYEDGSAEVFANGSVLQTLSSGACSYSQNAIEIPSMGLRYEVAQNKSWISGPIEEGGENITFILENQVVTPADYGAYVTNYRATNGTNEELGISGWRIFHTDGENVYLIADNYVKNTYIPDGKGGTAANLVEGSTYQFHMNDIAKGTDYTGMGDISSTLKTKLLSKFGTNNNTEYSGKVTAYLLDINKWSGFGNTYTDYAIGGPTIELFAESYNVTHEIDIDTKVGEDSSVYQIKWSNQQEYNNPGYDEDSLEIDYTTITNDENLYLINNNDRALGYWVASPRGNITVWAAFWVCDSNAGGMIETLYFSELGARPVVCLKSNVELERQADGSFKIIN